MTSFRVILMSKENAEINKKAETEHFDVLIVGAGISGVAAGVYLEKHCLSTCCHPKSRPL